MWLKIKRALLIGIAIVLMTTYPIYRNVQYGVAYDQYNRQLQWLTGESMFYNPWQYRVLCPLVIEGLYQIYTNTINKMIPLEYFFPDKNAEALRYYLVFDGFRVLLHLIIFWLCFRFYNHFIKNKWLIYFGLAFLVLSIGNAVYDSDFSFNNYVDVILYLWLGVILVEKKSAWWLILIVTLGALNRETSLLIPFLFWLSITFKSEKFKLPNWQIHFITGLSLAVFAIIFFSIRWYWGYRAPEFYVASAGLPMLKSNLFSPRSVFTYFETFGTVSILPLWNIYWFRKNSFLLQLLFISLIPIWFLAHFMLAVGWESRLFIMPTAFVFLPMALETIEKNYLETPN